jgi:hypothetical protein
MVGGVDEKVPRKNASCFLQSVFPQTISDDRDTAPGTGVEISVLLTFVWLRGTLEDPVHFLPEDIFETVRVHPLDPYDMCGPHEEAAEFIKIWPISFRDVEPSGSWVWPEFSQRGAIKELLRCDDLIFIDEMREIEDVTIYIDRVVPE